MGQIEDGIGRALQREGRDVNFANAFWKEFPGGDLGREAMLDGTVLVLDAVLDARTDAERADDVADLLPPQYRDRYSGFFWKAFTAAALTAAYRLAEASERPIRFGCIAEELALHAFVEKAELVMEGWQSDGRLPESANGGFGTFLDAVAEDNDVSMLWQWSWTVSMSPRTAESLG